MNLLSIASLLFITLGCFFFVGGGIGMLRLPDVFSRLHASTKADNLGLGLVVVGALLQYETPLAGAKLMMIWLLVLLSSSTTCHLIAQSSLRQGIVPWKKSEPWEEAQPSEKIQPSDQPGNRE